MARDSPAHQAGLQTGDLLIRIGDRHVETMDDIYRFLTEWPAGQPVKVTILRLGQRLELEAHPSEG